MSPALQVIGGAFVVVYLIVIFLAIRKPLLGRLALREGVRRPGQTLLVVGGLMVGAAGMTAALVGADSARDSSVLNAYRSWDATDLTVTADNEVFPYGVAQALRDDQAVADHVDGVMAGIEVVGSVSNKTRETSDSGVRLIGFDTATQAQFGAFTLADGTTTTGEDLGPREVLVSRQLADDLDVEVGDELKMGVEPLEKPKPTPKQIGNRMKALGNDLQRLQNEAERKATAAAKRAGKRAAEAAAKQAAAQYLAQVQADLAAQGQATAAAYLGQIKDFQQGVKDTIKDAKEAEKEAGLPPGSIPPYIAEPVPPPPPTITPPDVDAIKAEATAVATAAAQAAGAAAAQDAAERVGKRYSKRAESKVDRLEDLKDLLDETIDELRPVTFRVAGIAKLEGPGAYGLFSAVFAPLPLAQDIANTERVNVIRVSGTGDAYTGLEEATAAIPAVRARLDELNRDVKIDEDALLEVQDVKQSEVEAAEDSTEFVFAMLVGMSFLVIAAGIALVINLTQMLAEERRPRLATLRALGLTRRGLVTLSVLEGAFYSLLAALVGTGIGIFAGRMLAERFGKAFAEFFGANVDYRFVFSVRIETLATAFAAGALITLGTMYVSAWRTSRMSIPAAIRNLPEPAKDKHRRRWPRVVFGVALLTFGIMSLAGTEKAGRLVGGVAVMVVISGILKGRIPDRLRGTIYGAALAGWAFYNVGQVSGEDDPNKFFGVFTLSVLIAVIGLSLLAAANLRIVERAANLLRFVSRRLAATLRVPLAFLARRSMRTGLSIIMFAVIMAIISMFSVMLAIFQPQYERESLGYDIVLTSAEHEPVGLPASVKPLVEERANIVTKVYTGSFKSQFANLERTFAPLYVLDEEQFADPPMMLNARDEAYGSDAEVWAAVRSDPTLVVSNFGQPGDEITLDGKDGPVTFTIAATPPAGLFQGLAGPKETFDVFDDTTKGVTSLVAIAGNGNVPEVAALIERKRYKDGVTSTPVRELMDRGYRANRTMFSVIDVLMKMGLVVGILSLGILALRAIVERRHLIGVLRAIGFRKRSVMSGLLVEAGMTTTLGVAVGVITGLIMGWIFFTSFFETSVFGIDRENLFGAIALVYAAVVVVTVPPAWRASRLPPAEAVRYTE
ncbi:MAG: FtsX-like permease family protein [Actinomycetota bacterium]